MKKIAFLFALMFTMHASAEGLARCGKDAFGNDVCRDKDGVLTNAPKKSAVGRANGEANGKGAASGSEEQTGVQPGREGQGARTRCGTDPFGNKVCR